MFPPSINRLGRYSQLSEKLTRPPVPAKNRMRLLRPSRAQKVTHPPVGLQSQQETVHSGRQNIECRKRVDRGAVYDIIDGHIFVRPMGN